MGGSSRVKPCLRPKLGPTRCGRRPWILWIGIAQAEVDLGIHERCIVQIVEQSLGIVECLLRRVGQGERVRESAGLQFWYVRGENRIALRVEGGQFRPIRLV
jgi:hypothetical protein